MPKHNIMNKEEESLIVACINIHEHVEHGRMGHAIENIRSLLQKQNEKFITKLKILPQVSAIDNKGFRQVAVCLHHIENLITKLNKNSN